MPQTEDMPISDALRRFHQLAALNDHQLDQIAEQVELKRAARGTCLMEIGGNDSRLLFLLDGELELLAGDGARRRVRHFDPAADDPVSRLRPSRYRVTAVTEIRYLWVDQLLLDQLCEDPATPTVLVEEGYTGSGAVDLIDANATHGLVFDVLDDLNNRRIFVPSEPDIAIRTGRALNALQTDIDRIAKTLSICPAMTLKAVRAARAADPARAAVLSCKQAVAQLGADSIYEIAANCVLRESLRTSSLAVQQRMQHWWRRTMRVSAISRVMARMSDRFDPDFAALIGLLYSIAEPVMLRHADRHADLEDNTLLDNVLYDNRAELGRILLSYWDLPRPLIEAAALCNNWSYSHPGEANYVDIMLVAQWHAAIGGGRRQRMPRLEEVPAAEKLGLTEPSPKLSIRIVEAADSAVERTDRLLGAA
jgi:HD-like signal output (HDOD) protein